MQRSFTEIWGITSSAMLLAYLDGAEHGGVYIRGDGHMRTLKTSC